MKLLITADIHWGAKPPLELKKELDETIMKYLKDEVDELDAFVIAGDLLDSRQWLSSDTIDVMLGWLIELADILLFKNAQLYLVKGTRNHDGNQLDIIAKLLNTIYPGDNGYQLVKLINEVETITHKSPDDKTSTRILFLPEEYIADQEDYYKDYFNQEYDLIFGHGMIDKIWYAKEDNELYGSTSVLSAPVFNLDDLLNIGNYIYFGHVHIYKVYKERFQYIGPISSWDFGNTHAGYIYLDYCPDTKSKRVEKYIKNKKAPKLQTKSISIQEEISLEDFNKRVYSMVEKAHEENVDKLRIVVNLYPNVPNFKALKDYINSIIGSNDFLVMTLNTDGAKENTVEVEECYESMKPIVTDDDLIPAISNFISRKMNKTVSEESIKKYLNM